MMDASAIAFYIIGAVILTGALLAVTSRRIFRSAVWLLLSLTGIAAFYFWSGMNFLAAVQIVVYVGGIVVLIIFSIFLTQHTGARMPELPANRKVLAALTVLGGFGLIAWIVNSHAFVRDGGTLDAEMKTIGARMLSGGEGGYALPFEVVSVLLLAAMIGCIAIALKNNPR